MNIEVPLQKDMFTGQMVDTRTRQQIERDRQVKIPTQMLMFSQRDIAQIGVSPNPLMPLSPGRLVLISEDPRTEEEIERDLMRDAEALTTSLFADPPSVNAEDEPDQKDLDDEGRSQPSTSPIASEAATKYSAYLALVTLVREQAVTLWVDDAYKQRYYNQLPLAILAAQGAGLTAAEISAAMQIGEFLGSKERQAADHTSSVDVSVAGGLTGEETKNAPTSPSLPLSPQSISASESPREGLRMKLRREQVSVRTRQPKHIVPKDVPVLYWMEREYIKNRLPYLAKGIAQLDEDELASLAEGISEVLQETYWIILGTTLASLSRLWCK